MTSEVKLPMPGQASHKDDFSSVETFVAEQRRLLQLERSAEVEEHESLLAALSLKELEQAGYCLRRLQLAGTSTALYGRTELQLENARGRHKGQPGEPLLPSTKLSPGDIVSVAIGDANGRRSLLNGTVTRVQPHRICVVIDDSSGSRKGTRSQAASTAASHDQSDVDAIDSALHEIAASQHIALVQGKSDITHKRLLATLETLLGKPATSRRDTSDLPLPCSKLLLFRIGQGDVHIDDNSMTSDGTTAKSSAEATQPADSNTVADDNIGAISEPESLSPWQTQHGIKLFNKGLNQSQLRAVLACLGRSDVSIIHGPPGTGKTTTVVEVLAQLAQRGNRVLAAAPSNVAADNIVERLAALGIRCVRIGHPARLLSTVLPHCLDAAINQSEAGKLAKDVRNDMQDTLKQISSKRSNTSRRELWQEMKLLRTELRQRERAAVKEVLTSAQVVIGTTSSVAGSTLFRAGLDRGHFDIAVVDEAGQAIEASCWSAIRLAPRCILAGDHLQLPPTILSVDAANQGLARSLLEVMVDKLPSHAVTLLDVQYRMHADIMSWSSEHLYGGRLKAAPQVATHLLGDMEEVSSHAKAQLQNDDEMSDFNSALLASPVIFVDTVGESMYEDSGDDNGTNAQKGGGLQDLSRGNESEAALVQSIVEQWVRLGVPVKDIGIISPYNRQVERLRHCLPFKDLEISSVDGFQGREKEAIIMSLVRSNDRGEVGFLSDVRRMNVAVTRARRCVCLVADSGTISSDPHLLSLVDYMYEKALVLTPDQVQTKTFFVQDHVRRPERTSKKRDQEKDRMASLLRQVDEFAHDNNRAELKLPMSLSSNERRIVHEAAEKLAGVIHESVGAGDKRRLVLRKSSVSSQQHDDSSKPAVTVKTLEENGRTNLPRDTHEIKNIDASSSETAQEQKHRTDEALAAAAGSEREPECQGHAPTAGSLPRAERPEADDTLPKQHRLSDEDESPSKQATGTDTASTSPRQPRTTVERHANPAARTTVGGSGQQDMQACPICGTSVPVLNLDIHKARCARAQRLQERAEAAQNSSAKASSSGQGQTRPSTASKQKGAYRAGDGTSAELAQFLNKWDIKPAAASTAKSQPMPSKQRQKLQSKLAETVKKKAEERTSKSAKDSKQSTSAASRSSTATRGRGRGRGRGQGGRGSRAGHRS